MLSQNKQLLDAAESGQLNLVKQAIQGGADVNIVDESGETALMCAALFGYLDIVKYLIKVEADVSAKGTNGNTTLIIAAKSNNVSIVKWLIYEGKAEVDVEDIHGCTALTHAAANGYSDIVKYLIKANVNVNVTTKLVRNTALILAAKWSFRYSEVLDRSKSRC